MSAPSCNIDFITELRQQIDTSNYSPQRKQELLNRVDDFVRQANALGNQSARSLSGTAQEVREHLMQHLAVAQASRLSPDMTRNFAHWLSLQFDIKRRMFGLADEMTDEGAVREIILTLDKRGVGEIRDLVASLHLVDLSIQADAALRKVQKAHNIPSKAMELFSLDIAEMPHHPYAQSTYNLVSPAAAEFLRGRQQRVLDFARRYNINDAEMDAVAAAARRAVDTYEEIRQVIDVFDIRMGDAETAAQRYIPRQFSREATARIFRHKAEDPNGLFRDVFDARETRTVKEAFVQSRRTNHYIPEDEAVLDFILTQADPNIYEKVGVQDIGELIADNGAFTRAFVDHLDTHARTSELFDQLVDAGMIQKIPMSSSELYDYVATRYQMPFESPKEMLNVSFETRANIYRKQLEELSGRALAAQFVSRAAIEGEWGITRELARQAPETYKNFVPLVGVVHADDALQTRNGAIPREFALRFGMVGPAYENVLVHPIVADNIAAMLEVGTSPNALGVIARPIAVINRLFKNQALASTGFVFKQFFNNVFQTAAAGGALNIYAQDTVRVMAKVSELGMQNRSIDNLVELFDDTAAIYGGLTERQLWIQLRRDGFIEDIMPLAAANYNNINYQPDFGPWRAVQNQLRYTRDIWTRVDDTSTLMRAIREQVGQTARTADNMTSRFFYRFQEFGSLFDQISRLSTMKSLLADPFATGLPVSQRARALYEGGLSRGAVGNFRQFGSYDAALEHSRKYFFTYADLGEADKMLNRYVLPFWSFMSRNTFAVFKKMVREPHTFVAYQRVYAAMNQAAADEGEDYPAGGEVDWLSDTRPWRWVTPDGDYFAIPLTPLDPISEGVQSIAEGADAILGAMGIEWAADTPEQELNRLLDRNSNRGLENIVSATYPLYKSIYALAARRNPDTHRELQGERIGKEDSFVGFRTTPFWRYQLQTWSPLLQRVHATNPFGMFGRPDRFDEQGNLIESGTPAWLGNGTRQRRDVVRDYMDWRLRAARWAGINIEPVDVAFGMGYQQSAMSFALNEMRDDIQAMRRHLTTVTSEEEYRRNSEELMRMTEMYTLMRMDMEDLVKWSSERNIPVSRALRRIQQGQLQERSYRVLTEEERYEILKDAYGDMIP